MCGRYSFSKFKANDIIQRFGPVQLEFEFGPSYNIAPSQQIPVVIHKDGVNLITYRSNYKHLYDHYNYTE